MKKRKVDLIVISDVHLGTYGCQAKELLKYLKSVQPKAIVLNGDIIDIWQFSKNYWPESHMLVVRKLMKFIAEKVSVYYLTGNHDEMLRKFSETKIGSFTLENKLVLQLNGKKGWFFHGDIFDVTMQQSKWLAKLGAIGYDTLILLNSFVNWILQLSGREKMSFSKKIKARFKDAVKFINNFEQTAAEIAIEKGYDYVICGHIHHPEIKTITTEKGSVTYLNSGDWVENLSALEYHKGRWRIYQHSIDYQIHLNGHQNEDKYEAEPEHENLKEMLNVKALLNAIVNN